MDSTALIPALRGSAFLKQAANLKSVATGTAAQVLPAAGAVTAVGAGTDWDPAAMTTAGIATRGLGHPLAGLATRRVQGRADRIQGVADAAKRDLGTVRNLADTVPAPHINAPRPAAPGAPVQPAFDPAALNPTQRAAYDKHVADAAAADAALKARAPFSYTHNVPAPKPVRVPLDPKDPTYKGELTGYTNARAEDVRTIEGLAAAKGMSPDDYLKHVAGAAGSKDLNLRADFDAFEKALKSVNTRFNRSPAPADSLLDRAKQPFAAWQNRVTNADTDFRAAMQARQARDQSTHDAYNADKARAEAAARKAYDADPVVAAHQKAIADRQAFEAGNRPPAPSAADAAAAHAKATAEVDAANAAGRARYNTDSAVQRGAMARLHDDERAALAAGRKADTAARDAKAVRALGPVAAAGLGTGVGMTETGQAVGSKVNDAVSAAGSKVKSMFTGDPETDWVQMAKDYAPAILGVGAVGALAMWLMSQDDENEKTAAAPVDDDLARAARNRRRIEGLLARNPKALDNIGKHEVQGALDTLPIQLDASQRTKLASLLSTN